MRTDHAQETGAPLAHDADRDAPMKAPPTNPLPTVLASAVQVSVSHDEVAQLLRRLHAAEVDLVLCTRTGPGWIVAYRIGDATTKQAHDE